MSMRELLDLAKEISGEADKIEKELKKENEPLKQKELYSRLTDVLDRLERATQDAMGGKRNGKTKKRVRKHKKTQKRRR
jgi:hypothetical protein